jgi:hypothetical protein
MDRMTRMLPILDLGLAAQMRGLFCGGSINGFKQQASAQAGVATTK